MDTLVLNAAYQPIGIISWRKAMTKLHSEDVVDRVELVSTHSDRSIRTSHSNLPMPSVVRAVRFHYVRRKHIRFSRENVWLRDRGRCQYCGKQVPRRGGGNTYDHVTPRARGGKTEWTNIVTACNHCNSAKKDMSVEQAGMRLRTKPIEPKVLPEGFNRKLQYEPWMPEEWRMWLQSDYWHGDPDA